MSTMIQRRSTDDIGAAGYPAVREAFNEVLGAFVAKLSKADWDRAIELLEYGGEAESYADLLADTALFSRPGDPWFRASRKRPVDRLASKIPVKRHPLKASLARRLPQAFFSVFESQGLQPDGTVLVRDLVDEGREIAIMDNGLAESAEAGTTFAGRFVDLGPWHIGFGVIITLRKSEAVALVLALAHEGELAEKRDALHELVYICRIHDSDLVMEAISPMIMALTLAIDAGDTGVGELVGQLRTAL